MGCPTPFIVRHKVQGDIPVPCGKCPHCLKRRISGWSFRLLNEDRFALSSFFVTLTFDTDTVPISKRGFMTLEKRPLQLFFKRLRKANPTRKIKYYACGEYGGRTERPHYHIILFNADVKTISQAWTIDGKMIGHIHYGKVSGASVGYTLKYMSKPHRYPKHANDDRHPEFSLMSKGLGVSYLTPQMIQWHKADLDNRMHCVLLDNKKIAMPRYYKNKIYTEEQRKRVGFLFQIEYNKKLQVEIQKNPDYLRDQWEATKQAFAKMHKKAVDGRNKV